MLRIAIVQPSSPPKEEEFNLGLAVLREFGFSLRIYAHYDPGLPAVSAFLLTEAIASGNFEYLWAVRGGAGAIKILSYLDEYLDGVPLSSQQIPPLIGFSDITILHCYFWKRFRRMGIQAPMVVNLPQVEREALTLLKEILLRRRKEITYAGKPYREGKAEGRLMGGNLLSLASLCGTPYFPLEERIILFLEEVNEPLYKLERAFLQLLLALNPERISALVLGDLDRVSAPEFLASLEEYLPEKIPIMIDLPFGHGKKIYPLFFGAEAQVSCSPSGGYLTFKGELR